MTKLLKLYPSSVHHVLSVRERVRGGGGGERVVRRE